MRVFLLVLCSTLLFIEVNAQSFYGDRRSRDAIASFGTGVTSYFGDLNDPGDIIDPNLNTNIGLQYFFNNRVSGRAELTYFRLSGDDAKSEDIGRVERNLSFKSDNFEFSAVGMVHAFENGPRFYQRPEFNIYGFAGVGVLYFNPKAELDGQTYALQPIQTEGVKYSKLALTVIYGAGVKYMINPFWNVVVEGGYRLTFTDYLDDVSTEYVDNSSFSDPIYAQLADRRPEIGLSIQEAGNKRGEPTNNDGYFLFNIKIEFYLPPDLFSFGSSNRSRGPRRNIQNRRRR